MTTQTIPAIPLVIRGELIESGLCDWGGFRAPAVEPHLDRLVLADPLAMRDVQALTLNDIFDFLDALGDELDIDTNSHLQMAVEMTVDGNLYSRQILEQIYRQLPAMLRRSVLNEVVDENIGAPYLEGWVRRDLSDRQIAVRAFGTRAVHVIAGNSPIIAVQTVVTNALTRSDAIVKIPANDPYAAVAIARTMIDIAPNHPLTRHLSVGYWKGGDRNVEARLYDSRNIEKIVAWGGMASMRSIRQHLEPGIDIVALDPKSSASIIGREAFESDAAVAEAASRAAADIGYFNQGGCVSARVLYVETGTDVEGVHRASRFGERVFQCIQELPATLSSPHPAFDPYLREEIAGLRHNPDFRIFGGRANEGAVIVSQAQEAVDFSDRLDCRVANIIPVDSADDALQYLNIHTQTIGIFPDELKRRLRDDCAMRGAQRIVSLGFATSAGMAGPHDGIQMIHRMVRWVRDDTLQERSGFLHGS